MQPQPGSLKIAIKLITLQRLTSEKRKQNYLISKKRGDFTLTPTDTKGKEKTMNNSMGINLTTQMKLTKFLERHQLTKLIGENI